MALRSWVEIDLKQLSYNYSLYKRSLSGNIEIMAVIKANAYGHGDIEVARTLQNQGVHNWAVATLDEAIRLRQNSIVGQILVLGYSPIEQASLLMQYDITQTVVSLKHAAKLAEINSKIKVQFAIDTGMNRIGIDGENTKECESIIREYSEKLNVTGIFTHLSQADKFDTDSKKFTEKQIKQFSAVEDSIRDLGFPNMHFLNSAGGLFYYSDRSTFVRLGIILYGLKPDAGIKLPEEIRSVLSWYSTVAMVKEVKPGKAIGYGGNYVTSCAMKIATITTGYADGYNRSLSNGGYVLINGAKAPIVGNICMDQFMVDVSGIENVDMGTKVTLIGNDLDETITADGLAKIAQTIGYEIVCNVSTRVNRIYNH